MRNKRITKVFNEHKALTALTRKRACAYVRVSTDSDKQLQSLQNQTKYFERMIQGHPDFIFCGIYSDSGLSGAKRNRPGFLAMMDAARRGEVDVVITKSISRFARNALLLLESVRELRDMGIGVIFEEQGINTLTSDGEFMLTVLASIAEEERRSVCQNVRIALRNRAKLGSTKVKIHRLLGFDRDEAGNIIVNEQQAEVIRDIFRLYLSGMTQEQIADYLNGNHYPPYATAGVPWDYHQVRRVLNNEKYVGDCIRLKYYNTDDGKTHYNRGEMPLVYIQDNHIPIIPREEWDRVQVRLLKRKKLVRPCTGMIKCPLCGAALRRHKRSNSDMVDWVCATLLQKHKVACRGVRIEESALERLTAGMIPLKEPCILLEVPDGNENQTNVPEKGYRLVPVRQYKRGSGAG